MTTAQLKASRLERLRDARLYFVCDARPGDGDPAPVLHAALRGGADLIQLREKAPRCAEELVALAEPFRRAADEHGVLFFVCLLYTSPSPRDRTRSRMPSSA